MIHQHLKEFNRAEREIAALKYSLMALFLILVYRALSLITEERYSELWALLTPSITCFSVLIGCSIANRIIANNNIIDAREQRINLVRTTHYLIAVTKDLRQKVRHIKSIIDGKIPAIAFSEISKTIQKRYEVFYEPNIYEFLPEKCIDIVSSISGQIYGISVLSAGVESGLSENSLTHLKNNNPNEDHPTIKSLSELDKDLETLINEIYNLRLSVDGTTK